MLWTTSTQPQSGNVNNISSYYQSACPQTLRLTLEIARPVSGFRGPMYAVLVELFMYAYPYVICLCVVVFYSKYLLNILNVSLVQIRRCSFLGPEQCIC